nr:methanethiol S-methyltransferase [Hyphomonas sp. Mor2]
MSRFLIFAYGVASYLIFLGVFVYAIAFLGNLYIPNSIDADPVGPVWQAVLINLALLAGFAVQHSLMARPAFKTWWTKIIPPAAERSTYVLFSNLAMIAFFLWWQPIGGVIWDVSAQPAHSIVLAIYFIGWAILFYATCLLNHFELFGLRQIWHHLRGEALPPAKFRQPGLYKHVRHPIYVGWLMIFWATPTMTIAHLLFAVMTTAYILIAVQLEERDLANELGEDYRAYQRRVPMIIPFIGRKSKALKPEKTQA